MPRIPEYEMQTGELDTSPGNIPEIRGLDQTAKAWQNVGAAISDLGAHMIVRGEQTENTNAATLWQEEEMRANEATNQAIDNNEAPDGAGMTDTGIAAIKLSNDAALQQMPPRLREKYMKQFDLLRRRHAIHLSNVEDTKRTGYYGDRAQEFAGNKALSLSENPDTYEALKKENDAYIDGMPITPAAKERIKNATGSILSQGLADGEYKKDPQKLKERLGASKKSLSGGIIPEGHVNTSSQAKQLAFAWHELAGDPKLGMGAGSETAAYQRLKASATLEQAVRAGLSFERPSIPNFAGRLAHARNVLAGRTTPAGQRAFSYFKSKGLSDIQAAGFTGVLMGESGTHLNPAARNPRDPGTSIGVAQWNRDRKANMIKFTGSSTVEAGPTYEPRTDRAPVEVNVPGEVAPEYQNMSYEWRRARINKVDADLKREQDDAYVAAAAKTNQMSKDAIATLQANGMVDDLAEPTMSDFVMANKGDTDKGLEDWKNYQTTKEAALLAYKFKTMNRWEIENAIEQYKLNIPTGEGAALGEQLYSGLQAAGREAAGPKQAEEKFAVDMQQMWEKAQAEVVKDRTARENAQKNFDYNMRMMWDHAQAEVTKDRLTLAAKQYAAAESAAKAALEARTKDPFQYVAGGGPSDRNNAFPSVRNAWNVVAQTPATVPGYNSMTAVAIDTTYQAQKQLGVQSYDMQLVDPRFVDQVINTINSDTDQVSMTQKMTSLARVFDMTNDPHYKAILFNQFKKQGLPNEMRFALDALERGDGGAYSMLFYPALNKNLKPTEDVKLAKYKEEAYKLVNSPLGQAEFGSGLMDSRSVENVDSAAKLMTNFAIMNGGDPTQSATEAFLMMVGPKHHVDSTSGNGTKVNVSADNTIDDDKLTTGFNNLTVDVTAAYMSTIDTSDDLARTKAHQSVSSGSFVNYEDGYAFRTLSGRILLDPRTGETMKWSIDDVLSAADRPGNKVPESVLKGFGLLPEDAIMPEGPIMDMNQFPTPEQRKRYTPNETDKFYKLYGGR